ncbi:xanthine dehydrogenase family protein subunit M [Dehalococcoidia bacterium]|nr:xanthine dehydrogenase family protein subunit M [Dehalococcoidia bacterium]
MLKPFQLISPTSVVEASRELKRLGETAKIYAGGSELLLLLRHGLADCDHLVDVKGIDELQQLRWDGHTMHIGACVTHRQLEKSSDVGQYLPLLRFAEARVANVRVRNIGTLGGNLCFGDPHSDPGTALLVYDARVKVGGGNGERILPLEEFFKGQYETALEPDDVLKEVEVDPLNDETRGAYIRVARFERPSLGVAVAAGLQGSHLTGVRLAVGCVGPVPIRLRELEAKVEGASLNEGQRVIREARDHLCDVLEPVEDLHGSVEYKTYLAGVLLARALGEAVGNNGGK